MTNNEVNQYIHEKILGQCWHGPTEWKWVAELSGVRVCSKCKEGPVNPDYCSDDSPRSLLLTAVMVTLHRVKRSDLAKAVMLEAHPDIEATDSSTMQLLLEATAEQIARACAEAHKSNA